MICKLDAIKVLPSSRPTVLTVVLNDEEVALAFNTEGESLRERMMLALLEALVYDIPEVREQAGS